VDRIVSRKQSTINFKKYRQEENKFDKEQRRKEVTEMSTNIFKKEEQNLRKMKIDENLVKETEKKIELLFSEKEERIPIQPQYTKSQKKIMARYGQKNKNKPFEENKIDEKQKEILKASETKPLTESMSKDINCMELKTAKACKNIDYCDPIYAYPEWYNTRLLTEKRPLKRKPKKKFKECVLKPSDPISNKIKEDYDTGKEPPSEKKIELVSSGNEEIIPVEAQSYTEENKIDKEQRREEVTKMLTNIFQKDEQNLSKTKIDENRVQETEKKIELLFSENEERIPVKAQSSTESQKQITIEKEKEHSINKNLSSRSTSSSSHKSNISKTAKPLRKI